MPRKINYKKGDILGNCVFLEETKIVHYDNRKAQSRYGKFRCYCGNEFEAIISFIKNKKQKSCGCITQKWAEGRKQHIKHGQSKRSTEYSIWLNMKRRCRESNIMTKHRYFDRGIEVCKKWSNNKDGFQNFYKDMGPRPSNKHSLDRIDVNGNYSKENCRWATISEQNSNKTSNIMISYKGESKCLTHWAKHFNLSPSTLKYRLKKGLNIEQVFKVSLY